MHTELGRKFRHFRFAVGVYLTVITFGLAAMFYLQQQNQHQIAETLRLKNYDECLSRQRTSGWFFLAIGTLRDAESQNPVADKETKEKRLQAYDSLLHSPIPPVDCEKLYGPAPKR